MRFVFENGGAIEIRESKDLDGVERRPSTRLSNHGA